MITLKSDRDQSMTYGPSPIPSVRPSDRPLDCPVWLRPYFLRIRRWNAYGRQVNRKFHHATSCIYGGRKKNSMKRKFKNWIKVERMEYQESWQKMEQGAVDTPPIKIKIDDDYNNGYKIQTATTICVSIGKRPKEHPSEPLEGNKPRSMQYR